MFLNDVSCQQNQQLSWNWWNVAVREFVTQKNVFARVFVINFRAQRSDCPNRCDYKLNGEEQDEEEIIWLFFGYEH